MTKVLIVGCGIVGAAIAYELSHIPNLDITVLDAQQPAQGSTGASLGVLMGIISQKVKGKAWKLRDESLRRYETLIPELEQATGQRLVYNRQGILWLRVGTDDVGEERWRSLAAIRQQQGWALELWEPSQVQARCPHIAPVVPAVYSPQDRQLDPTQLTHALVEAARQRGVTVHFDLRADALIPPLGQDDAGRCQGVQTNQGIWKADWIVLSAGLGTPALAETVGSPIAIGPVLGQAAQVKLPEAMGLPEFQPMITGDDVHIVPQGQGHYWVGATVEFPPEQGELVVDPQQLEPVMQAAIALCPALAEAEVIRTWSGLRPRPSQRAAPVIDYLSGFTNVILATGHYRNGVLLAPATAARVKAYMGLGGNPTP